MIDAQAAAAAAAEPFFTNDAAGYARILFAYLFGMGPLFGLVVWFLRYGPNQEIAAIKAQQEKDRTALKGDINGLGAKVDDMRLEAERDRERTIQLQREIADNQREVIDRIVEGNQTIQSQLQKGDVRMARVEERCDIAGSFERLGERIEKAVEIAAARRS